MGQTDFLGKGFAFPIRIEGDKIAISEYEKLVEESILILLSTRKGERVMRPDFGSDIHSLVFGHIDSSTTTMIGFYIRECLDKWEPRIEVTDVTIKTNAEESNKLDINIEYKIRASNSKRNLVYPFYLEGSR